MRKTASLLLFLAMVTTGLAQNPFATNTFYDEFKKVYGDGQNGFPATKGAWINETGIFYDNYKVTTRLPGADSGKLSIPQVIGFPLVAYYFKPSGTLAAAKKSETNLHVAVKTAWAAPLIEVKRTDTLKEFIFYKTLFYKDVAAQKRFEPEFETYIVKEKGVYLLVLTINGRNEPKPVVTVNKPGLVESDPDKKIRDILAAMDNLFANEKGVQLSQNQYYTEYESLTTVYGQKCKLKDRQYEISWNFTAGSQLLSGPEEAKAIYDKLLAVFTGTGRFVFKQEIIEGSRTYIYASEKTVKQFTTSRYSLVLEYYNTPGLASVSFLINRQKF
ncbi:MAG: hypothetical protein JNM19_08815 [Chitinophagaceae bacterium]|nr:hypothetical protein [Chitinophagaceae bacterium]